MTPQEDEHDEDSISISVLLGLTSIASSSSAAP